MNRYLQRFVPLLMGLFFLACGLYMTFFEHSGMRETTAVIERIVVTYNGADENNDYDVYVKYTVDGIEYRSMSDYYAHGYEEGKTIRIWYDPADPNRIHGDSRNFGIYVICAGAAVTAAGVVMLLRG